MSAAQPEQKPASPWVEYERRKSQLPADLSPEDREVATRQIAEDLGI